MQDGESLAFRQVTVSGWHPVSGRPDMGNSTYEHPVSTTSRSRVIGRCLRRTLRRPARAFLPLVLAPVLAIGSITLSPPSAYASIPEVSTALPQGRTIPSGAVAFGSTIVWDTSRSSDTGATWNADAALADRSSWDFVGGGKMARIINSGLTATAVVYTPSSGGVQNYDISSGVFALNGTYATYGTSIYTWGRVRRRL
jgi:hypothetical protein